MERQCWVNAQYSSRECFKITGIPSAVNDSYLKDIVCRIVIKAGVAITDNDIEDCHRVGSRGKLLSRLLEKKCQRKFSVLKKI